MGASSRRSYLGPAVWLLFFALGGTLLVFWRQEQERQTQAARVLREASARSVPEAEEQRLQKFSLTGFDDQGKRAWNLQGDSAAIDLNQSVFLEQNVTLKLKDDVVVRTERVSWSQDGGLLRTDSPVRVEHPDFDIDGVGAVGRPSDNYIQLNRDIRMVLRQGGTLTCRGPMKMQYGERRIEFYRDVKITDERGTLEARRMDVTFDGDQKKIEQVVATGDVRIQRGADTTRSQRAIYTVATGSVRLEGSPEITIREGGSKLLEGLGKKP